MRIINQTFCSILILLIFLTYSYQLNTISSEKFTIAVHTGAGSYERDKICLQDEEEIKYGLAQGLKAAYLKFKNGSSGVDAIQAAIEQFENNPLFNAGVGSKIDESFHITMDASIMNGKDLSCGAVAGVSQIKNPIQGARLVMEKTKHVLLEGKSADEFAKKSGLNIEDNSYFFTEQRIEEWYEKREKPDKYPMGTTGAVAVDSEGNLTAGTSTGGITMKMSGRVGDSPIIGAGNYANNLSLAVSCTGTGEIFMKNLVAYDIHARMYYKGINLKQAVNEVMDYLPPNAGGFVAVDKNGNVEMPYNTSGMARGYVNQDGIANIYVFEEGKDLTPIQYDIKQENIILR